MLRPRSGDPVGPRLCSPAPVFSFSVWRCQPPERPRNTRYTRQELCMRSQAEYVIFTLTGLFSFSRGHVCVRTPEFRKQVLDAALGCGSHREKIGALITGSPFSTRVCFGKGCSWRWAPTDSGTEGHQPWLQRFAGDTSITWPHGRTFQTCCLHVPSIPAAYISSSPKPRC